MLGSTRRRRALDAVTNEALSPKHVKKRTVPMSPRLAETLASLPRLGLWIVSRRDGGPLGYWALLEAIVSIYDRAKVARPPNAIHCLRHTFGTVMGRRVPLPVLQKLMGHADVQTTMRYVDVNEEDKRDAIAAVFGACAVAVQSGPRIRAN
jgi:integrase